MGQSSFGIFAPDMQVLMETRSVDFSAYAKMTADGPESEEIGKKIGNTLAV